MRRSLPLLAAAALFTASALSEAPARYQTGGSTRLSTADQSFLDANRDIITLGINTDWMAEAGIDPVLFLQAFRRAVGAVREGHLTGLVLYANRPLQPMMPIAVGHLIRDPETRPLAHSSLYQVGDLTGPLITGILVMSAAFAGTLDLDEPLSAYLSASEGTALGALPVRAFLTHRTGLPQIKALTVPSNREESLAAILALDASLLDREAASFSELNYFVLARMLEAMEEKPFATIAEEGLIEAYGMPNSTLMIEPRERQLLAPGPFDETLGRLAWGDPLDALDRLWFPNSGHRGFISSADELAVPIAGLLLFLTAQLTAEENEGDPSLFQEAFTHQATTTDGRQLGLLFPVGSHGPGSFFWESDQGTSFVAIPEKNGFVIVMTNADHPSGVTQEGRRAIREVVSLLIEALGDAPTAGPSPH